MIEYETTYAQSTDITFILKHEICNDHISKTSVIAFYYGKPNEENTKHFVALSLKAPSVALSANFE